MRRRLCRPEGDERRRVSDVMDGPSRNIEGCGHLAQGFPAAGAVTLADHELRNDGHITGGRDRHVERQRLLLELQLGIEVVADQGVKERGASSGPALQGRLARAQERLWT